jgi:phytoene dehydrogenase-like protein
MAEKSIIIGAGLSGLSAGCYGQMNGYRTSIFEAQIKPGGLCTTWERKGYTNGTIGWVTGSGPANNDFHRFWQELGAVQGRDFIDHEEFTRIEGRDGQVFVLYTDIDRLEQHMHELAPEDKDVVAEFIQMLRAFTQFKTPVDQPPELSGPPQPVEMPPFMMKWMGMSLRDSGKQFKNPFLREAFSEVLPFVFFGAPGLSITTVLSSIAWMHLKAAGYPVGGPLEFVRAIERRYLDLGGEIHYKSPVAKILVENDRAVGVRLVDGTEHRADIVISAADGHTTIFDMLEGKYISDEIRSYYDTLPLYPPLLLISLGVARPLEEMPPGLVGEVFPLDEPITIGGRAYKWLGGHKDFDPGLAPEGKTRVGVTLDADYEYWRDLRQDRKRYKAEKEQVADQVIELLDRRYPGLAAQVEMRDVATPVTFERFTGNWRGSWMGWVYTPRVMNMHVSKTLPGLTDFYMIGAWVLNPGTAFAATSGRHVTQLICAKDEKPFVTTVP